VALEYASELAVVSLLVVLIEPERKLTNQIAGTSRGQLCPQKFKKLQFLLGREVLAHVKRLQTLQTLAYTYAARKRSVLLVIWDIEHTGPYLTGKGVSECYVSHVKPHTGRLETARHHRLQQRRCPE
jgi:hypothetical protein